MSIGDPYITLENPDGDNQVYVNRHDAEKLKDAGWTVLSGEYHDPGSYGASGGAAEDSGDGGGGGGGFTPLVDQWRLTADLFPFADGVDPLSSDLSRAALVGDSGMALASGIWTFPSTGVYTVDASLFAYLGAGGGGVFVTMYLTTDFSSESPTWTEISQGSESGNYQIQYGTITVGSLVDVTSVSEVKLKFAVTLEGNPGNGLRGSPTSNRTFFTFSRLGDT
jgi:hypothetical protein